MSLRLHRRLTLLLVFIAALITAAIIGGWWLSRLTPRWWLELDAQDPKLRATAESVENGMTTVLSAARPSVPGSRSSLRWTMTLNDRDASAWLTSRLPAWVEHQMGERAWPKGVSQAQVVFEDGAIIVGARMMTGSTERYVSISFSPRVDEAGRLWIESAGARVGELPAPLSTALSPLDRSSNAMLRRLAIVLRGGEAINDPVIPLADQRHVRIVGVRVSPGVLTVECETITRER